MQEKFGKIKYCLGTELKVIEGRILIHDDIYQVFDRNGVEHRVPKSMGVVIFQGEQT